MKVNPPLIELKSENHGESEKEQKPLVTWRNSSFGSKAKQSRERKEILFSSLCGNSLSLSPAKAQLKS